ncbi:uncharacterized protein FIBRA_03925 [Fibroporia radiculosa]|uniref:Uncharacterized protein n=1 Tax=Fibroporia radiculosa TaxID=599839 RepID=J4H2N9_9APHY|nr:uncharacterized protein FIBRA_03925 [Fibroporia radiculosa]CCM01854.1 predicted protein [Fibroporia radiculosa]
MVVAASFAALRMYAISAFNKTLSFLVLVFGLAPAAIHMYIDIHSSPLAVLVNTSITCGTNSYMTFPVLFGIPYILVSRFIFNLRTASEHGDTLNASSRFNSDTLHTQTTSLNFAASFVGNLSGPLDIGSIPPPEDESLVDEDDLFEPTPMTGEDIESTDPGGRRRICEMHDGTDTGTVPISETLQSRQSG